MKAVLWAAAVAVMGVGVAEAKPAGCSLVIAKADVFSGTCEFDPHGDGSGGFVLTSPDGYFVYVNVNSPGEADGYWNGWEKDSHAHSGLGTLLREKSDGACWSNGYARVCAR